MGVSERSQENKLLMRMSIQGELCCCIYLQDKAFVGLVRNDSDLEVAIGVQNGGVGKRQISDLVQRITSIGNQLTKKDFLVGVEGVNNKGQQLIDISAESEGLSRSFSHLIQLKLIR